MSNLAKLELTDKLRKTVEGDDAVRCIVEAPRGATAKLKYDRALKAFVMGRELMAGLEYPYDWGFLPSTSGEDGDPLDVVILHDSASTSGTVIPSQIIGVLEIEQAEKDDKPRRNDRFFAVPIASHREDALNSVDQLPERLRQELEQFFISSAALENRNLNILGWHGPERAKILLEQGAARFARSQKNH